MAGNSLGSLVISLGASTLSLESDFARASQLAGTTVDVINSKIASIGSGANFTGLSSQVQSLTSDFSQLQSVLGTVASISIGVGSIKEIESLADAYQGVSNRILTTVASSEQLVGVQDSIFAAAQQSRAALDDTAKTYQRLEQVIEGTGASQLAAQTQAIALTKILNEEIVVSGSSANEASHAIMDLVHGLAGGELQTRQLNQILRQMPDLAKQIAAGLGVSVQQLEAMAKKGIDTQAVLQALQNQAGAIDSKFQALPQTFAQAWQVLSNSVEQYVGRASQASAVSDLLKASIVGIADHIGAVATGAEAVAGALALWATSKGLQTIAGMTSTLYDAVTAQGAYKTAAVASAEVDVEAAAARQKAIGATVARIESENDLRLSALGEAQAAEKSLLAEAAVLEQRQRTMAVGANLIAEEQRLAVVRTELAAASERVVEIETQMTVAQERAALAEQAEATATVELTVAKGALNTATTGAASAFGALQRGASGLFAAMGGMTGLILAEAAAFYYLATQSTDVTDAVAALNKESASLGANLPSLTTLLGQLAAGETVHKQSLLEVKQAQLEQAEAQQKVLDQLPGYVDEFGAGSLATNNLRTEVKQLSDAEINVTFAHMKAELASVVGFLQAATMAAQNWKSGLLSVVDANADALAKEAASLQKHADEIGKTKTQIIAMNEAQDIMTAGLKTGVLALDSTGAAVITNVAAYGLLIEAEDKKYAAVKQAAAADDAATAAQKAKTEAMKDARKELTAQQAAYASYQKDVERISDLEAQLATGLGGPYVTALKTYQKGVDELSKTWSDAVAAGTATDQLWMRLTNDGASFTQQLDITNQKIAAQTNLFVQQGDEMSVLQQLWGVAPQYLDATKAAAEAYNKSIDTMTDLTGKQYTSLLELDDALQGQIPKYQANRQAINDVTAAQKQAEDVSKQWQGIATSGFDSVGTSLAGFATGSIKTWDDLGKSLVSDTQQFIAAIIAEFLKLEVFNGIINSIFGLSGSAALPTFSSIAAGSASFLTGGAPSLANLAATDPEFMAGGSLFGTAASANSAVGGGNSLLNWLTGGGSLASSGTAAGGGAYSLIDAGFGPDATLLDKFGGIGGIASIVGGVLAGVGEFKNAGGGLAGLAGGAAYGYGTYVAGSALAAGGGALLAGEGVGAALSAGLAAVPVIGWVALGAMVLDKISGGNLFGTSWKPDGQSNQSINIGSDGGTVTDSYEEKKKSALFGGNKYKWVSQDGTADQQSAVDSIFTSIHTSVANAAKALGVQIPDIIGGAFKETFDSSGKMTAEVSTVLGKSYNETIQQFAERVTADNLLALLPAAQNATAIADQWQSSADTLLAGTELLVQAQADINAGNSLLGSDTSLKDIADVVQSLEASGETLIQTYARLEQETQTVNAAYDMLGVSTGLTGEALVKFDDQLTTAAGGLQNVTSEFNQYFSEYYSQAEQQAASQKQLQKNLTTTFAAIGEDSSESMATFRQHMDAALSSGTLTADQVQQWFAAAQALYLWTDATTKAAAATQAATDATNAATAAAQAIADSFQLTLNQLGITTGLTGQKFVDFTSDMVKTAGSLSAAESAWNTYFKEYYSASEQAKVSLDSLRGNSASQLGAIGEDPNETMAKFKQDFANGIANGTITGDQIMKWLAAGDALSLYTNAVIANDQATTQAGATLQAAQDKYTTFISGFDAIINPLDAFEQSMASLGTTLEQNIEQANALAVAAGQSGASAADLGKILEASAIQGAAALAKEEADAQNLVAQLMGTTVDQLTTTLNSEKASLAAVDQNSISAYGLDQYWQSQIDATQKQIDAANAAAKAASDLATGTSLLKDFGDIGSITGQSLASLSQQFGIPLDVLAQKMGLTNDQLKKQFDQDVAAATAAIDTAGNTKYTNELLADILALSQGKPLPYTSTIASVGDSRNVPGADRHIGGGVGVTNPGTPYIPVLSSTPSSGGTGQVVTVRLHPEDRELLQKLNDKADTGNRTSVRIATATEGVLNKRVILPQPVLRNTQGRGVTA